MVSLSGAGPRNTQRVALDGHISIYLCPVQDREGGRRVAAQEVCCEQVLRGIVAADGLGFAALMASAQSTG